MALTLDTHGQFITTEGKTLGIVARQTKAGRWQYRNADNGNLYASGMTPDKFALDFWYREDFSA